MVAALQYPGLFSAAVWESLCPVDKLHFWGSPLWIPQNHVEIQEANFILVTLKEKKKEKVPGDQEEERQRDFYRE